MNKVLGIAPLALIALMAGACSDDDDAVETGKPDGGAPDSSAPDAGPRDAGPTPGPDGGIDAGALDAGQDAAVPQDANVPDSRVPGVTSSASAYLVPVAAGVQTKALLTVGDAVGTKPNGQPYRLVGIPDGLGAKDNGNGTFSVFMNHELTGTAGIARAHGGTGAFVSQWDIRKDDQHVLAGKDLIQSVQLWDATTSSYKLGSNVAFGRFCSADLAPKSALFHAGVGFDGELFLDGEETGDEGRALAHGLDGVTYELPRLGKASWENLVASPKASAKTIVIGMDDTSPTGQVYVYVGTKTNTGSAVEKAGLTNGTLYGVAVPGVAAEDPVSGIGVGTFTLASLGNVENQTGAAIAAAGDTAGVTGFLRPEDGAWDPSNPNDFYFATTASVTTASRLWRLRFTNLEQPELGGSITAVLDGSEGQKMLDNLTIDPRGHILLTEDVGNNDHIGRVWRYTIANDTLVEIAQHDPTRFMPGAAAFITRDEESSGILDATNLLGAGWFLIDVQAHVMNSDPELVEQGQLLGIYDPGSL
ncbi:MAG: hypothetical protein ABW352_15825 [Polyangiales bacterium]